jgi:hypothetical protein
MRTLRGRLFRALLAVSLVLGLQVGQAVSSPPPVAAAATCHGWNLNSSNNSYSAQVASGYWVYGNLRHDWCINGFGQVNHYYDYRQETRYCAGCSARVVDVNRITARAWKCGALFFNTTLTKNSTWINQFNSGYSDWGYCAAQADATFYTKKNGVFEFSFYRNY